MNQGIIITSHKKAVWHHFSHKAALFCAVQREVAAKGLKDMRSSIRDVARLAGVSPMTVSNVLRRRSNRISDATRERVELALKELKYIPIQPAVQNRHVETKAIGVAFVHGHHGFVSQPTFQGLCDRARDLDYDLLVFLRSSPHWMEPDTEVRFLDRRCDGYVFVGTSPPGIIQKLIDNKIPIVECYSVTPLPGAARVISDNVGGIQSAVRHLVALGHKRIGFLGGALTISEAFARREGFVAGITEAGLPENEAYIIDNLDWAPPPTRAEGAEGMRQTIESLLNRGVTGVVCSVDELALNTLFIARSNGLSVPQDLSITGMDNIEEARREGLTTLHISFDVVGRAAVNSLVSMLHGTSYEDASVILPLELIVRSSSGPVPHTFAPQSGPRA